MPYETLSGGLDLEIPTRGTRGWYTKMRTALSAISSHSHTGTGDGNQIGADAISSNAVTRAKLASTVGVSLLGQFQYLYPEAPTTPSTTLMGVGGDNSTETRPTKLYMPVNGVAKYAVIGDSYLITGGTGIVVKVKLDGVQIATLTITGATTAAQKMISLANTAFSSATPSYFEATIEGNASWAEAPTSQIITVSIYGQTG